MSLKKVIGCIGKCTSGLTQEELNRITNNIDITLSEAKARKIFRKYLEQSELTDYVLCLSLYEKCCKFLGKVNRESENESVTDSLVNEFWRIEDKVNNLDSIPKLDLELQKKLKKAGRSNSIKDMKDAVEETIQQLQSTLLETYNDFKKYIVEPCPLTK